MRNRLKPHRVLRWVHRLQPSRRIARNEALLAANILDFNSKPPCWTGVEVDAQLGQSDYLVYAGWRGDTGASHSAARGRLSFLCGSQDRRDAIAALVRRRRRWGLSPNS